MMKKIALFILLACSFVNQNQSHFELLIGNGYGMRHVEIAINDILMREEYKELVEEVWIEYKRVHHISIEEQFLIDEVLNNINGYSLNFANVLAEAMDKDRLVDLEDEISIATYRWFKYQVSYNFRRILRRL